MDDEGRASLRIPLTTIRSTTYAYYPDESHSAIRRVFTPPHAPSTKRHFCGFCGTPLSYWSEESPEEADWICVNLGSFKNESVERMEDAGLLSTVPNEEKGKHADANEQTGEIEAQGQGRQVRSHPWFEEMIEGSELGRIRRRRGGETSSDGKTTVEWEAVEIGGDEGDDAGAAGTGKRKLGSLGAGDDSEMRG